MEPEACPACGADEPLDLTLKDPLAGTAFWDYDHLNQVWRTPMAIGEEILSSTRTIEIELPDVTWKRIDRIASALPKDQKRNPLNALVADLLDHVQQGVYHSGAWERGWLEQCVGEEAVQTAFEQEENPL